MSMGWYIQHGTLNGHFLRAHLWLFSIISYIFKGKFEEGILKKIFSKFTLNYVAGIFTF